MSDYDGKAMSLLMRGGEIIDEDLVLRGMQEAADDLDRDIKSAAHMQEQNAEAFDGFGGELAKTVPDLGGGIEERLGKLRALEQADRDFRLPEIEPRSVTARVFTGSIGGVETPGYDYRWTHAASNGPTDANTETADRRTGEMVLDQYIDSHGGPASLSSAAALGFYFRPSNETGLLRLDASPAYEMALRTYSWFSNAKTRAWIGFNVGEYQVGRIPACPRPCVKSASLAAWITHGASTAMSVGARVTV